MDAVEIDNCLNCEVYRNQLCHRPQNSFFPVVYRNKRYDATKYAFGRAFYLYHNEGKDEMNYQVPLLPMIQKCEDWDYEKEWRFVCLNTDRTYINMKADALYLGDKISADLAIRLIKIAREKNIHIYKMEVDYFSNEFNLVCRDWTDYTDKDVRSLVRPLGPTFG